MQFNQLLHERKPNSHASLFSRAAAVCLTKNLKDMRQKLGWDSLPTVLDNQAGLIAFLAQSDFDLTISRREFHRIVKQVPGNLSQTNRVALNYKNLVVEINRKGDSFSFDLRADGFDGFRNNGRKGHGLPVERQFAHLQAREIEQVRN